MDIKKTIVDSGSCAITLFGIAVIMFVIVVAISVFSKVMGFLFN